MDSAKDSENFEYDANSDRKSKGSCVNLCSTDHAESLQPMSYKEKREGEEIEIKG